MKDQTMRDRFLAIVTFLSLSPAPTQACGGFFCNNSAPVEQAAEQIAFGVKNNEVTAHIQIRYQGDPAAFAWILPLPSEPSLDIGTDELFTLLGQLYLPQFSGQQEVDKACYEKQFGAGGGSESEGESEGEADEVSVEFRGAVGPYDAAVITSDDADAIRQWLEDEGYDLPDGATALLDAYVKEQHYFVALKLLPDADAGDIAPIVVRFAFDRPCIPLRLTAVAAAPDMPIRAWIFGDSRAVSTNYASVLLDWAGLRWMCGYDNYDALVSRAVDEAGGRAFVTEFAGAADDTADALYWSARFDLDALAEAADAYDFLSAMLSQSFSLTTQLTDVLAAHIAPPEDMTFEEFMGELGCYSYGGCDEGKCEATYGFYCWNLEAWETYLREIEFDSAAATAEIETAIVQPLAAAQAMMDAAEYVTGLYTTMSAHEMTVDPMFGFANGMPEVYRLHQVHLLETCTDQAEWVYRLTVPFEDGDRTIYFDSNDNFCAEPGLAPWGTLSRLLAELPSSARVSTLAEGDGAEKMVLDNRVRIDEAITLHNEAIFGVVGLPPGVEPSDDEQPLTTSSPVEYETGGCACAVGGGRDAGGSPAPALLASLALAAWAALRLARGRLSRRRARPMR